MRMPTVRLSGVVLALLSLNNGAQAFVDHSSLKLTRPRGATRSFYPTQPLFSSSKDDDELSKLIGKRSQIRRKKKEDLPSEEKILEELNVDPDNLDLDKMPDFQTKRISRSTTQKDKETTKEKDTASAEAMVMDYLADYEDENEFHIPNRIGISTRCWGDETLGFVSSGKLKKSQLREGKFVPGDLQVAMDTLLSEGVMLVETSPEYGKAMAAKKLSAEDILAKCIKDKNADTAGNPVLVGTYNNKIFQRGPKSLTDALAESCKRLRVDAVELYQVANLGWLYPSGGLIKGMSEGLLEAGQTNYAGVKNLSPLRLRRVKSKMEAQDLVLTSNSFEFSLTNRKNQNWITSCKTLGVIPLIRNPLDGGLASGQFTASNPSGGLAGTSKFSFSVLEKLQPLHSVLESVAEKVKTRVIRENRDIKEKSRGRYGPTVSYLYLAK
jgi:aryl-alcohol dehydrogenase-like predicted oxidoreductase